LKAKSEFFTDIFFLVAFLPAGMNLA